MMCYGAPIPDYDTTMMMIRVIIMMMMITALTRMWANAQPDGCPAEHRWRPLFNAAKFG